LTLIYSLNTFEPYQRFIFIFWTCTNMSSYLINNASSGNGGDVHGAMWWNDEPPDPRRRSYESRWIHQSFILTPSLIEKYEIIWNNTTWRTLSPQELHLDGERPPDGIHLHLEWRTSCLLDYSSLPWLLYYIYIYIIYTVYYMYYIICMYIIYII